MVAHAQYTRDVGFHLADTVASHPAPFEGTGAARVQPLDDGTCDYLSVKDALLIRDAVLRECDTFLTIERKLTRQAERLSRVLGIEVLRPPELWDWLKPQLGGL